MISSEKAPASCVNLARVREGDGDYGNSLMRERPAMFSPLPAQVEGETWGVYICNCWMSLEISSYSSSCSPTPIASSPSLLSLAGSGRV